MKDENSILSYQKNFLTFMKENKFICHIDNSNEYTRSQKYANGWKYSYIDYFYTKNLETD